MINVICYKTKTPTIYNKGTKYEKQCDEFLACYGYTDDNKNNAFVNHLNSDKEAKAKFCKEHRLNSENIAYFFSYKQEPFDTRGD